MDINYIKSSISKIEEDNVLKFILDLVADGIKDATNFEKNKVYRLNDKVYIYENGTHHVYKCIVDISTPGKLDLDNEWSDLFY